MRTFLNILKVLGVLYVAAVGGTYLIQREVVFQPKSLEEEYPFTIDRPCEEYFLDVPGGGKVNAVYVHAGRKAPEGVVLYFHGNRSNLRRWIKYHADFTGRGYDFFAIDYRGYGKSSGKPGEKRMYEDARIAYDWLRQRVPAEDIVIYGRSIGTGVASTLATQVPARQLILETPYDNIRSAIQKAVPVLWLPFPLKYHFQNDENLPEINYPVYIFQGTKDRIIPYRSAVNLKPLLRDTSRFITIPGGRHGNLNEFKRYQRSLERILAGN